MKLQQERMQPEKGGHDQNTAVTILDTGRVHEGVKQQSLCVSKDLSLLSVDLCARVEPCRLIERRPFSALLTLGLSMIAAVGRSQLEAPAGRKSTQPTRPDLPSHFSPDSAASPPS